ncbi:peptide chain release factor N(5)-glutamine methyltransferase [Jeotgalicoccus meleagridis]|uniref:Release factor glutamine methyltransferase n=1 Tax=Jeotgalicoccus meleagridis TaxID=2759181 RepID=A0A6V7RA65_9STAP|nr:peptide chain release factor N(5)-glutamine methyltransferase [Jeotgalicoccus meleagridis]CAD2073672.1 Release factor glutamine methyltransferase [Jeotgalicoccus meleagridis]
MKPYKDILKEAKASLSISGKESRLASILMEEMFGMNLTQLMLHGEEPMPEADLHAFEQALKRVMNNEPYQYVLGSAYFYDAYFKVTPDTLIPRPETEELVDYILKHEDDNGSVVADIGTGSGVIGLTLQKHWQENQVFLSDISYEALEVAKLNGKEQGIEPTYLHGDLFEPFIERGIKLDILVSNPPYISQEERHLMSPSVLKYEPMTALFAEDQGLYLYKAMISNLPSVLKSNGRVYFEIGFSQGQPLLRFIEKTWPNTDAKVIKDINGNDRILHFTWGEQHD